MTPNLEVNAVKRQKRSTGLRGSHLLGVLMLLGLFTAAPSYAQMGSSAVYSDTWLDTTGVNSGKAYEVGESIPGAYVVGWGVTQDYNNIYNHTYWVQTTLKGPDGRTVSVTSGTSSSYARAEVKLPFTYNPSEVGDFSTTSTHIMRCPYIFGATPWSSTFDLIQIGISLACYRKTGSSQFAYSYSIVSGCLAKVSCPGPGNFLFPSALNPANHLLRYETWLAATGFPRTCTGRYAFVNSRVGCDSGICQDFPPIPPVARAPYVEGPRSPVGSRRLSARAKWGMINR